MIDSAISEEKKITKYTATIKGCITKNELGDIIFKGNYREKKAEKRLYGAIIKRMMNKLVAEYDEEEQKYKVVLAVGMEVSFGKEQFEELYDLTEVVE